MTNYILLNVLLISLYMYFYYKMKHGFHMLQLESYMNDRYKNWMNKNKKEKIKVRDLLLNIPILITIFNTSAGLIIGVCISLLLYFSRQVYKAKKPLVYTKRVKRLFTTSTILFSILAILGNIFINTYIVLILTQTFAHQCT